MDTNNVLVCILHNQQFRKSGVQDYSHHPGLEVCRLVGGGCTWDGGCTWSGSSSWEGCSWEGGGQGSIGGRSIE